MKHFCVSRSKGYICCIAIETMLNATCVKRSEEDETAANCFKDKIHDIFSQFLFMDIDK